MTDVLDTPATAAEAERDERERRELLHTWSRPRGFLGWMSSTNHKDIGLRFIVTAVIFFLLAGLLALAMRIQLAFPESRFLAPDHTTSSSRRTAAR